MVNYNHPEEKMLEILASYLPYILILACIFMFLYYMGGDDIIFFRRKKYAVDPNAQKSLMGAVNKFARMRDFTVMGPTTLEFGGQSYSFDAILLSYYGTVAFKTVPFAGDVYGDGDKDEWVRIFEGVRKNFANPVKASSGSVRLFRDIYRREKVKGGLSETMIVFTNRDANVAVSRSLPVCHVNDLDAKLTGAKFIADNNADIPAMKRALEKYIKQ